MTSSVVLDDAIIGPGADVRDAIVDLGTALAKETRGVDDDDPGITVYSDSPGDRADLIGLVVPDGIRRAASLTRRGAG